MSFMLAGSPLVNINQVTAGEKYLRDVLATHAVDTSPHSSVRALANLLLPTITNWTNGYMNWLAPSGSFAKGTAVWTGTDLDLFISLRPDTPEPLHVIHDKLFRWMSAEQLRPRRKNTAIGISFNGFNVDLVPGRRQSPLTANHSLFRKKTGTWKMTDVVKHVNHVRSSGLLDEIRLFKVWRDQKKLEFPSFYLELILMAALPFPFLVPSLEARIITGLSYIRDNIMTARIVDPANTNNVLSDELTLAEKRAIRDAASTACEAKYWEEFVR